MGEGPVRQELKRSQKIIMANGSAAEQMIEYLKTNVLRDSRIEIDEDTTLISSGIMDSYAVIEALLHLEKVTNRKISLSKVSPHDINTVRQMLATAQRVGEPRS